MRITLFLLFSLSICCLNAQNKVDFQNPLKIPMYLSGNFGEMRTNHFHTGLDIKTNGKIGIPVYSIEEGFVSRIKVSHYGYGNALYVEHPNGFTSVYAHLDSFNEEITKYLRDAQYELEEECVYLYPNKNQLILYKGEQIALSGNTGHSGGPHLHFEIRDTESERPINPHLLGIKVRDEVRPVIQGLMLIPLENNSLIEGNQERKIFYTAKSSGECSLKQSSITVGGKIGLAIKSKDQYSGSNNACAAYKMELYQDGELIYEHQMDTLDFATNRYINAHLVYDHFKESKSRFEKNYILPCNPLSIYGTVKNNGQIRLAHGQKSKFRYVLTDISGNTSTLNFELNGVEPKAPAQESLAPYCNCQLLVEKDNVCEIEDLVIYIPKGGIYEDVCITLDYKSETEDGLKRNISLGDEKTPLQNDIIVKWQLSDDLKDKKDQLVVLEYDSDNKSYQSAGGEFRNGMMELRTKSFGTYAIGIDTIRPYLSSINLKDNMANEKSIQFKIGDDLSGLKEYNIYIDDKWVLGEYNRRSNRLSYQFDSARLSRGEHTIEVVAKDVVGNTSTISSTFLW